MKRATPKEKEKEDLKTGSRICYYQSGIPKCHYLIACADSHFTGHVLCSKNESHDRYKKCRQPSNTKSSQLHRRPLGV